MLWRLIAVRFLKKPCIPIHEFVRLVFTMQVEPKIDDIRAIDSSKSEQSTGLKTGQEPAIKSEPGELGTQQAELEKSIQEMHQVPNNSVPVRQVDEPKKKKSVMTKILISIGALVAAILGFKFFLGSKKSTE